VAEGGQVRMERREAHRLPVRLDGRVDRHSDPQPTSIQVADLSVGGCLILGWTAPPGTPARLVLDLRDGLPPLTLRVRVMRQAEAEGRPAAGVRFEEPYPLAAETRVAKVLRQIERELARSREEQAEEGGETP
jgi:c-di-GMP-binding flagellar brake protein YcgR